MSARSTGQKPVRSVVGPIEKGVKMPQNRPGFVGKYPWKGMAVGDSFHVQGVTCHRLGNAGRTWIRYQCNGWKFTARTEGKGARIWRIK